MTSAQGRTGGQLVMDCLMGLGAKRGFGVPGESYLAVLDAMADHANAFSFMQCRHEGGAAYMAAASGRLTGEPGLCFVTRGPGATNASVGIHTAMQDSAPMILFVGQIDNALKGREAFQEVDYRAFFGPLAKWAVEIEDVRRIPEIVSRAWTTALSGRPGPVVVALPEDVLSARSDVQPCGAVEIAEPAVPPGTAPRVEEMLAASQRPVLLVGGCRLLRLSGFTTS